MSDPKYIYVIYIHYYYFYNKQPVIIIIYFYTYITFQCRFRVTGNTHIFGRYFFCKNKLKKMDMHLFNNRTKSFVGTKKKKWPHKSKTYKATPETVSMMYICA